MVIIHRFISTHTSGFTSEEASGLKVGAIAKSMTIS
jgi:hypothetical protein